MRQREQPKYQLQVTTTLMTADSLPHHLESSLQSHGIPHFTDEKIEV